MNTRFVARGLLGFLGVATLGSACIPDPKGDYDTFVAKNAITAQTATAKDAGPEPDVMALDVAADGMKNAFLALCYSSLSGGTMKKTLRFIADTNVKPGSFQLTLSPLDAAARTMTRSSIVGKPIVLEATTLGDTGKFTQSVATADIVGAANTLSGRDITVEELSLDGRFAAGKFCSSFDGRIIKPITSPFTATCIYVEAPEGEAFAISADELTISVPGKSVSLKEAGFSCQ
jgi:hypothetical protein